MRKTMNAIKGTGYTAFFLLLAILLPVTIWVAIFVALRELVQERQLRRVPSRTIPEILTNAGLQWEDIPLGMTSGAFLVPLPTSKIRELLARAGL